VPSAPSALPTSSAAGASAPGGGAGTAPGTASGAKPGSSTLGAPPATSQPAKAAPAPSAASCAHLRFLAKKQCEAKLKK
jgi:serine/threonine-protein kinase